MNDEIFDFGFAIHGLKGPAHAAVFKLQIDNRKSQMI
jgi:hypothetical protein